jgi:hypothetical protein
MFLVAPRCGDSPTIVPTAPAAAMTKTCAIPPATYPLGASEDESRPLSLCGGEEEV